MKKSNIKYVIMICLSAILVVFSLVFVILSFEKYDDGYGVDYSFDYDWIMALIVSIGLIIYSLFSFRNYQKQESNKNNNIITILTLNTLVCFYDLGVFFKALFKAISKGNKFNFSEYVYYFIFGLLFLISTIVIIILKRKDIKLLLNKNKE